ncbi:MAG TPA: DUF6491 family protein [Gammaproteobacteria bacterium]|nr:DUF6491 family protein [Gammaproteobacteria bacterium]
MFRASKPAWLAAATAVVAASAVAQDDTSDVEGAFDRTPQNCILVSSIDGTDAVDDQNLIFRMRGDKVFRNHLPRKCPGLERENRIAYEARNARLCSIDTITVLEQRFGVGLQGGFTCRLGEFIPLSPAEVEDLDLRERQGRRGRAGIQAQPVAVEAPEAAPAGDAAPADAAAPAEDAAVSQ